MLLMTLEKQSTMCSMIILAMELMISSMTNATSTMGRSESVDHLNCSQEGCSSRTTAMSRLLLAEV